MRDVARACEQRPGLSRCSTLVREYGDRFVVAVMPHEIAASFLRAVVECNQRSDEQESRP